MVPHETACILNGNDEEAHISITVFFADREPIGPYRVTVAPRRTPAPPLYAAPRVRWTLALTE